MVTEAAQPARGRDGAAGQHVGCAHRAALRICSALDLALTLLGKGNAEHAEREAVGGLDVNVRLDQRLPLAHHGAQLVGRVVHALQPQHGGVALLSNRPKIMTQINRQQRLWHSCCVCAEGWGARRAHNSALRATMS